MLYVLQTGKGELNSVGTQPYPEPARDSQAMLLRVIGRPAPPLSSSSRRALPPSSPPPSSSPSSPSTSAAAADQVSVGPLAAEHTCVCKLASDPKGCSVLKLVSLAFKALSRIQYLQENYSTTFECSFPNCEICALPI